MKRNILILLCSVMLAAACQTGETADLILHGGKVVTVDPGFTITQAVAVKAGRVMAVGSDSEILRLSGSDTEKVNVAGRMVLPGLIDSHIHALGSAMYEFTHEVPGMESIEDVLGYVRERASVLGPGKWILVSQVFITRLREQRYPTRAELDAAAPENPVVFRTGPDASLNSLALKLSGIDRNFQITDGQPGRIERDGKGNPTGILRQCSRLIKYESPYPEPTDEDRLGRLKTLFADYNSVGITSVTEGNTDPRQLELLRTLYQEGQLTLRLFLNVEVNAQLPMEQIEQIILGATADPLHQYNDMLWVRGAKSFLDGGMLTGSAYMREPWGVSQIYSIEDPEYVGMRYIEQDKLVAIMRTALSNGIQFTAHCQGDAAVLAFIDAAAELAGEGLDIRAARPNITHGSFMSREAVSRMAQLGVVANIQPNWLQLDGATLMKHFGPVRTEYFQPFRALFDERVMVGGGSDHMQKIGSFRSINQYNPFLGMWTTLARTPRWMDEPFHPEQIITRQEAIRLYTINNAFLSFEEDRKGSLEPGKLADMIVVDRDLLECPLEDIPQTQVEKTYLGGRLVYQR